MLIYSSTDIFYFKGEINPVINGPKFTFLSYRSEPSGSGRKRIGANHLLANQHP